MSELEDVSNADVAAVEPSPLPLPGAAAPRSSGGAVVIRICRNLPKSLKFSVRQLEALGERRLLDAYRRTTFIRGFVRSYARYLRVDEGAACLRHWSLKAPVAVVNEVQHCREAWMQKCPVVGAGQQQAGLLAWQLLSCCWAG